MIRKAGRSFLPPGFRILFLFAVLLASSAGCFRGKGAMAPPSPLPGDTEEFVTRIEEPEPASDAEEPPETEAAPAVPDEAETPGAAANAGGAPDAAETPAPEPPPAAAETAPPAAIAPPEQTAEREPGEPGGRPPRKGTAAPGKVAPKSRPPVASLPGRAKAATAAPVDAPAWAEGTEVLVYRVEFLGMTMGYARFTFRGKVTVRGNEAYHLNVRAWTSDFLSVIYPINDSIDYYLDAKTLAPLRLEFARAVREKDDVAIYDQENGKIVYRYKRTGEIRKQVDVPPETHDPVSVAYYFRARDLGVERPRHVYGGRKMWEISSKLLGRERIDVSGKPFETLVVKPILRQDGKVSDRGEVTMWLTNDARHVPVRIYAKFKKIREWTLNAELMPPREGG